MSKSNAQRQAEFRKRQAEDKARLNIWVDCKTKSNLDNLCERYSVTIEGLISKLVNEHIRSQELDDALAVLDSLRINSSEDDTSPVDLQPNCPNIREGIDKLFSESKPDTNSSSGQCSLRELTNNGVKNTIKAFEPKPVANNHDKLIALRERLTELEDEIEFSRASDTKNNQDDTHLRRKKLETELNQVKAAIKQIEGVAQ